jgi:hypothetical protein
LTAENEKKVNAGRIGLKEFAEILGIFGVIGSLVFVAFEIRQNTDAVRSATIQALSEQSYESIRVAIENPDVRAALRAAESDQLEGEQRQLMFLLYTAVLRISQNRYLQAELGVLDEEMSAEIGAGGIYRFPVFTEYWAEEGDRYSAGFQDYVVRNLLPLSQ